MTYKEIWTDIPCFNDYQVSTEGRVRSKDRIVVGGKWKRNRKIKGRILKTGLNPNGYEHVTLRRKNKPFTKRVHHLVAMVFLGPKPNGLVCHHIDGNKLNNNVDNLEYVSKQKNTQEYYKSIGKSTGEIPLMDISTIIDRVNKGEACIDIAREYDVTRNDIAVLCKVIALTGEELQLKD